MRRLAILIGTGLALAGSVACGDAGNQFRVIPFAEAQTTVRSGQYTVVEAVPGAAESDAPEGAAQATAAVRWEVPFGSQTALADLPPGPLLIVAPSRVLGYRSAAAAARARHRDVLLFISESAEERRTLYAPLAAKGATS